MTLAEAKEKGLEIVDPSYFYTEKRFKTLQRIKNQHIILMIFRNNALIRCVIPMVVHIA